MFHLKARWIPKSEKGRKVARYLRAEGLEMTDRETCGHYAMNWACWGELTFEQKRHIAFLLDPEAACAEENRAFELARDIRDNPEAGGILFGDAERGADRAERAWLN